MFSMQGLIKFIRVITLHVSAVCTVRAKVYIN